MLLYIVLCRKQESWQYLCKAMKVNSCSWSLPYKHIYTLKHFMKIENLLIIFQTSRCIPKSPMITSMISVSSQYIMCRHSSLNSKSVFLVKYIGVHIYVPWSITVALKPCKQIKWGYVLKESKKIKEETQRSFPKKIHLSLVEFPSCLVIMKNYIWNLYDSYIYLPGSTDVTFPEIQPVFLS